MVVRAVRWRQRPMDKSVIAHNRVWSAVRVMAASTAAVMSSFLALGLRRFSKMASARAVRVMAVVVMVWL